jgi:hypothetical protein
MLLLVTFTFLSSPNAEPRRFPEMTSFLPNSFVAWVVEDVRDAFLPVTGQQKRPLLPVESHVQALRLRNPSDVVRVRIEDLFKDVVLLLVYRFWVSLNPGRTDLM